MRPQLIAASILLASVVASPVAVSYGQVPTRAAGRLTGTVTDGATAQPVAYASVAVLAEDGSPVAGGGCGGCGYAGTYSETKCQSGCGEVSQRYYHVPRAWLSPGGGNLLVLLEEFGGDLDGVTVVTRTT